MWRIFYSATTKKLPQPGEFFSVSKLFDTLLKNASIFSRGCSPLHAPLGQRTTQGHTGGLRSVFSDAHVPGKNGFYLFFPPPGGKTLPRALDQCKTLDTSCIAIKFFYGQV